MQEVQNPVTCLLRLMKRETDLAFLNKELANTSKISAYNFSGVNIFEIKNILGETWFLSSQNHLLMMSKNRETIEASMRLFNKKIIAQKKTFCKNSY